MTHENPLREARGIICGAFLGALLWALIWALIIVGCGTILSVTLYTIWQAMP